MQAFTEGLVYVEAEDHIDLAGLLITPTEAITATIILIHGNTSNFYDYVYVGLARELAGRGWRVISGNTRGHDIAATVWDLQVDAERAGGSGWEVYEQSPADLAAWVDFAAAQGAQPIILCGHSLGAAKVVLYQGQRQDARLSGLVLASPDLRGHWSAELVQRASELVAEGQGDEGLLPFAGEPWYRLSARNVVSRAALQERAYTGSDAYMAALTTPTLVFFGAQGDVGGDAELTELESLARGGVTTRLIEGAGHVYVGQEAQVADVMGEWLKSL